VPPPFLKRPKCIALMDRIFKYGVTHMSNFSKLLMRYRRRLRHFASIILFMIYIAIATAHFCKVDNPRVMGGLHVAAAVAHLL
jgi:hypothetical protein